MEADGGGLDEAADGGDGTAHGKARGRLIVAGEPRRERRLRLRRAREARLARRPLYAGAPGLGREPRAPAALLPAEVHVEAVGVQCPRESPESRVARREAVRLREDAEAGGGFVHARRETPPRGLLREGADLREQRRLDVVRGGWSAEMRHHDRGNGADDAADHSGGIQGEGGRRVLGNRAVGAQCEERRHHREHKHSR